MDIITDQEARLPAPAHLRLDLSGMRRILAVSDPHGEYAELERRLDLLDYDDRRDALVLNGDLVDRGPDSMGFERWISRPNVHRSLGNHDTMPMMFLDGSADEDDIVEWGGRWFLDLAPEERRRVALLLADAPIALTVVTPAGREVGFVHADCLHDWNQHVRFLSDRWNPRHVSTVNHSLWSRITVQQLLEAMTHEGGPKPYSCEVENIDHVFHGHTSVKSAFAHHDRTWMDTGACFAGGSLTVIDVDAWLDDIGRNSPFL